MAAMSTQAQTADKTIIITSDWHLSDSRSFDADCYYAWTDKNQERILLLLNDLAARKDQWDVLALDGDIFELWRTPVDRYMTADAQGNVIDDVKYLGRIKEWNKSIFTALEQLRADGKEIVYTPGNHDLTVSKEDVETAFPGLFTCAYDAPGTGIYEPFGEGTAVAIEHGNRYEYFNAPYQHGEFGTVGVESTALLAPGYFTSKLGASATVADTGIQAAKAAKAAAKDTEEEEFESDGFNRMYLASIWNAIRAGVGSPSFNVKTRIDGIGTAEWDSCRWQDYAVSATNNPLLFKDSWTVENWKKRQQLNKVPVYIPLKTSLLSAFLPDVYDELAYTERLCNTELPTLICVWGHSHDKRLTSRHDPVKGDVIYLNDGAWVDKTKVVTYGVIRYTAANRQYAVELRKYEADGNDALIDCKYLYVPENNATRLPDGTWQFRAKAMLVDGDATDISDVQAPAAPADDKIYNLNGQRLSRPTHGINIINGKRVLVK